MTTPIQNDPVAIQEPTLQHMLDAMPQFCKRLTIWEKKHADLEVPLTALVCDQIRRLCATYTQLKTQITEAGYISPEIIQQTQTCCITQLVVTWDLLSFHEQAERGGQEGALNVLYARMHILNNNIYSDPQHHNDGEDNLVHLVSELKRYLSELDPGCTIPLPEPTSNFAPRYLHNYKSLADTQYTLDPAGEVFTGSFGIVQKVNNKRSGKPLAMKTFNQVFSEKQVKKILREIGILEVCSHKNIVRFVEAFRTDDDDQSIRLVMHPWAPYTLLRFLHSSDGKRKARCPWFQQSSSQSSCCMIYRIMYQLADAVDYLHGHAIKHKDLKPDNILLYKEASDYPTALITDVGVSKVYIPGAPTNYKDSTYEYLAPEQHAMVASTFKSDIWQLGCCFAAILAVASKGQSGYEELHESFNRDDENCQCSIALEHSSFMSAFGAICMRGNPAQKMAYAVVVGMLELDPQLRPSIDSVKVALMKLPGMKTGGTQLLN
ncbi:hypothetical protein TrVGV298_000200 [Trichoderma virens]|nr:hypothetical protein TrVGV298_000200 [Trichoderma virens]